MRNFNIAATNFDKLFEDVFKISARTRGGVPHNVYSADGNSIIELSVPGFTAAELDIEYKGTVLAVRGKRDVDEDKLTHRGIATEFEQMFTVGAGHKLSADLKDGLLTLIVERAVEGGKKIPIGSGRQILKG